MAGCLHAKDLRIGLGGPLGTARLVLGLGSQIQLTAASATYDGLTVRDLQGSAGDVHLSTWKLLTGHPDATVGSVAIRLTVTQQDIDAVLHARGLPLRAQLSPGGLDLSAVPAGVDLGEVHATVSASADGRTVNLTMTPSVGSGVFGLRLPSVLAVASLPRGETIEGISLGQGSASVAFASRRALHFASCPAGEPA